jgi:hypothetical protein
LAQQDTSLELSCTVFPPHTTEAELIARFGSQNVTNAPVFGMDDGPTEGTVLFADRPDARVEILWWDAAAKRQPASVFVRSPVSRWGTPSGILVGSDLRTLERVNRRPFRVAGFSTERQGAVISWAGGALERPASDSCIIHIHLQPRYDGTDDHTLVRQVRFGREFSSGHPALQALNPRVVLMRLSFRHPSGPAN